MFESHMPFWQVNSQIVQMRGLCIEYRSQLRRPQAVVWRRRSSKIVPSSCFSFLLGHFAFPVSNLLVIQLKPYSKNFVRFNCLSSWQVHEWRCHCRWFSKVKLPVSSYSYQCEHTMMWWLSLLSPHTLFSLVILPSLTLLQQWKIQKSSPHPTSLGVWFRHCGQKCFLFKWNFYHEHTMWEQLDSHICSCPHMGAINKSIRVSVLEPSLIINHFHHLLLLAKR